MNEKELVKEVLAAEIVHRTLEREKRRVQLLTAFTVFLWVAVLVLGAMLFNVFWSTLPRLHDQPKFGGEESPVSKLKIDIAALDKVVAVMTTCIILIGLAALCTILLILLSRRTTLRHVDAGLADIAEQLKQLRDSGPRT